MSPIKGKATKAQSIYLATTKKIKNALILNFYKQGFLITGYWGNQTKKISDRQTAKAVQDQFNFGSGEYTADLKLWKMEQNIDIGEQIYININTTDKWLNKIYKENVNKKNFDKEISFEWYKQDDKDKTKYFPSPMSFGGDPLKNAQTFAWPFGRTSAKCNGNVTIFSDNSFLIKGELEFKSDTYSWRVDGKDESHNFGISSMGSSYNWKGLDGHGSGKWHLAPVASIAEIGLFPLDESCVPFQSSKSITIGSVLWSKASSSYPNGEMPVNYSRKFYFFIVGKM